MATTKRKSIFNRTLLIWIVAVGLIPPLFSMVRSLAMGNSFNEVMFQLRRSGPDFLFSIFISAVLFVSNTFIYDYSCRLLPKPEQQLKRIFVFIPIALISSNLLALGIHFIIFPQSNSPEVIFQIILIISIITLIVSLIMIALYLIKMWKHSIVEKELLEKTHVRTQLECLRTQINPHFLFNSLNALQSLVDTDPQKSKEFIQQLSKVYRYVLDHQDELVVELKQELDFIKSFVYLNQIRFGKNLQFKTNIQPANMSLLLPPLTLQILVENAIKHNIISAEHPLQIEINSMDQKTLIVTNNLQLRGEKVESTGIGLNNLIERYKLIHSELPEFNINENSYVAKIPFISGDRL